MQICKRKILSLAFFLLFSEVFCLRAFSMSRISPSDAKKMRLDFVNYSKQFVGCPYVLGATGPDSFDCSGLIYTCSRESIKVQLPRKVSAIYKFCEEIEDSEREAGDLVFFKTTGDGSVSHIGIYMGNNQFIHCASDGPNTGVIISSLRENYWKTHYFKSGRFLPASKSGELAKTEGNKDDEVVKEEPFVEKTSSVTTSSILKKNGKLIEKLDFEATFFFCWNFFTAKNMNLVFHGLDAKAGVRYTGCWPEPFFATDLNWEFATGVVQIPIEIGAAINPYIRFYFGPVFTIGEPHPASKLFDLDDDDEDIKAMILPGILGMEFQTPRIKTKLFDVTFVQDIRYIFYSKTDGSSLNFAQGMGNGFVFATGVRAIF